MGSHFLSLLWCPSLGWLLHKPMFFFLFLLCFKAVREGCVVWMCPFLICMIYCFMKYICFTFIMASMCFWMWLFPLCVLNIFTTFNYTIASTQWVDSLLSKFIYLINIWTRTIRSGAYIGHSLKMSDNISFCSISFAPIMRSNLD